LYRQIADEEYAMHGPTRFIGKPPVTAKARYNSVWKGDYPFHSRQFLSDVTSTVHATSPSARFQAKKPFKYALNVATP